MFRAARCSSSGALNCICILWFIWIPTSLVKADGCVRFGQFPYGVLISVYIYGLFGVYKFDIHGSVHRRLLSRYTNKMQLCNIIYHSKVY